MSRKGEPRDWRKLERPWTDPTKDLPYGGGGLPKTRIIGGHRYYLHNWGPSKPRRIDVEWSKKMTGAKHGRVVKPKNYDGWAIYVRP